MTRRLLAATATTLLVALAGAAGAAAATLHAAPAGAGSAPCAAVDPCPIEVAVEAAEAGDEIELAPGTYEPPPPSIGALLEVPDGVHMHGASRTARSEIRATGRLAVRLVGEAGLSDLDVSRTGEGNSGGLSIESGSVERVRSTTTKGSACYLHKGEIRSSVCATSDPSYSALDMLSFNSNSAAVVGSTLYGAGAGLYMRQATEGESTSLTLVNTIVHGETTDVVIGALEPESSADANFVHSNYDPERVGTLGEGTTAAHDLGGNQAQPPLFVAPGANDFRQLPDSPTIDAGLPGSATLEPFDVLGAPRTQNGVPDIGAHESTAPPLPPAEPPLSTPSPSTSTPPVRPKCRGKPATIIGTSHRDVIRGTRHRDVIVAFGGPDVIRAFGGNDLICAGAGPDRVFAGAGRDVVLGQAGADLLRGQRGRDLLLGNAGNDRLFGGPGLDRLRGGRGHDRVRQQGVRTARHSSHRRP